MSYELKWRAEPRKERSLIDIEVFDYMHVVKSILWTVIGCWPSELIYWCIHTPTCFSHVAESELKWGTCSVSVIARNPCLPCSNQGQGRLPCWCWKWLLLFSPGPLLFVWIAGMPFPGFCSKQSVCVFFLWGPNSCSQCHFEVLSCRILPVLKQCLVAMSTQLCNQLS